MAFDECPKIHVNVTRTINLGDFESEKLSVTFSHVPFDADDELIKQMMYRSEHVYDEITNQMGVMIEQTRENHKKEKARLEKLRKQQWEKE